MIWIIVGIVVILILFVIGTYNSLISLRNKKDDQWSQIEVQLKRRADLIPNLVETVKGYAKHENNTLKEEVFKFKNAEPELIRQALNKTYGNITAAAQLLEISRQNLNYKMKKYNLKRSDFKQQ